jgi:DNA-binding response OmpR family regulator
MRILVVDDHVELQSLLERSLERDGHEVLVAGDVAAARTLLGAHRVDLLVLDLGLPDGSGLGLCRELRDAGSTLPVLVLTAQTRVAARVESLDAGADDHLGKPFAVAELRARVRALARRAGLTRDEPLRAGEAELDFSARRAFRGGRRAMLTAREWEILELLASRKGVVVTRGELLQLAWRGETGSEATLEVLISRIRRKLGADLVRTVRGEGYAFEP